MSFFGKDWVDAQKSPILTYICHFFGVFHGMGFFFTLRKFSHVQVIQVSIMKMGKGKKNGTDMTETPRYGSDRILYLLLITMSLIERYGPLKCLHR